MSGCVFCEIVAGGSPADIVCRWDDALAFRPLDPVTNGHTLVVPAQHVANYTEDPEVTAAVMRRTAELAPLIDRESNLITSSGAKATQTVFHLHIHIVPRRTNDGLHLPWTPDPRIECTHCGRWVVETEPWAGHTLLAVEGWPVQCAISADGHHAQEPTP